MSREEMLQDLAYARSLAEEGRQAPLLGGAYLMFWGLLNGLAFTGQWILLEGLAPRVGGEGFALLWISYGVVAFIGMTLLRLRTRTKPGLTAIGVRAERTVWMGAAAALVAIVLGSIGRMLLSGDVTAPNAIFGAAFGLYGAALIATASLADQGWLKTFGLLALAVAFALCLFANENWAYLAAAAGSLVTLALPGVVLLRREPSPIV